MKSYKEKRLNLFQKKFGIIKKTQDIISFLDLEEFLSESIEQAKEEEREKFKEVQDRMMYFYLQIGGKYLFPNSKEGDLLKMVHELLNNQDK